MESFLFSLNATLPIFLTMLCGTVFARAHIMSESFTAGLNSFVFKVALPLLLFYDLATQDFAAAWDGRFVLFCFAATSVSIALIVLVARQVISDKALRGEFIQVSYRSSAAILGIAFIQNIYGSTSSAMAALMILGSVPLYNVVAVVVLELTSPAHLNTAPTMALKSALKGVVTNPIIIGIAAGMLWSVLGLPRTPLIMNTVHNLAVLATPLGLLAMGAGFKLEQIKDHVALSAAATFIKLVGISAVVMSLAIWLGFRDQQLVALLIMSGSASTVSCYIMAKNMGHAGELTSTVVMLTTLGCSITLTTWLWLLRTWGLVG